VIHGILKSVGLGNLEIRAQDFKPIDPDCFGEYGHIDFGDSESDATQGHWFLLCSPTWLAENLEPQAILRGQGIVIQHRYDGDALVTALSDFAKSCISTDRQRVYEKLSRLGFSEFEDFNDPNVLPSFFIDRWSRSKGYFAPP
jgi:hypothetical protein